MRSMKGHTMCRPGVSVSWYLPRRSTTHACCCGTTLMVLNTNTTTMNSSTRDTLPKLKSIFFLFESETKTEKSGWPENQPHIQPYIDRQDRGKTATGRPSARPLLAVHRQNGC